VNVREIPAVVLVGAHLRFFRGTCNRTSIPIDGAILVVDELSPELHDAIVASAAVICARGGPTGHMQSLCRSRGIPVLRVDPLELDALVDEVTIRLDRESVIPGKAGPAPQLAPVSSGTSPEL
jgi:pyruvate, water dikinase